VISADSADALYRALTQVGTGTAPRPFDAYIAALFALVVVIGVAEPVGRGAFWGLAGFYVLSAFTAAQASLLSLMASAAIGALVAVVVRYAVGSPNVRPRAQQIAQVLLWRVSRSSEWSERPPSAASIAATWRQVLRVCR
jgi:hypothetical protein